MKRDTIDNAVKRGVGGLDGSDMNEVVYEGYAPGGVAVLVECLTDNKNRTVSEVRHAFTKHGGNLGTDGSVSYLFKKQGEILVAGISDIDAVMDLAIESGATDVVLLADKTLEIITEAHDYHTMLNLLQSHNYEILQSQIASRAQVLVPLDDETAVKVDKLLEILEDLDDVQEVYSNAEYSEAYLMEE
jgi:YebC/PmpR family DNA-binding regulatory protein